ncbi:hypothetical protein ACRAWF_47130 [Streptomyces sp. L7]
MPTESPTDHADREHARPTRRGVPASARFSSPAPCPTLSRSPQPVPPRRPSPRTSESSGSGTTKTAATGLARVTTAWLLDLRSSALKPEVRGKRTFPTTRPASSRSTSLPHCSSRAQDAGRGLTQQELAWATAMIEHGDNDAANALPGAGSARRAPGLEVANKRLGLSSTVGGAAWQAKLGLTQTTAMPARSACCRRSSPAAGPRPRAAPC